MSGRAAILRPLPRQQQVRMRWRNDGGWTTEIARDDNGEDFRWRVSIAEIEADGPFSSFPGVERELLLLDGNGIELDIDDAPPLRLDRRFAAVRFAGEAHVDCRLLAGPTRDFNVMARRGACTAQTWARPLVGPMAIFAEPGVEWLVHVFSGHATARSGETEAALGTGDSLHIGFADGGRVLIEGGGELLLVKFGPPAGH